MSLFLPPTAPLLPDWVRKVATAVNALLRDAVRKNGETIYTAPTISDPPTAAEVQAIAEALAAVSDRLK